MKATTLAAALVALALPVPGRASEAPYADAWDPTAVAAADAAVARLAGKTHLAIESSVLAIQGLTSGITASVQQVRQAMQDLGARETDLEVRVELPADVLFDFDRAEIRADAATALAKLATLIRAHPSRTTELFGHTDSRGDNAYNLELSQRRAEAVKRWLVEREGLPAEAMSTRGAGESQPVATNDTDDGRQRNRRVEAVIHKR